MTETRPEVYVATTITIISDSYASLVETLNHMKSLIVKDNPGGDVADFCDAILVDFERLDNAGAFKNNHIGYILRISQDTSNYRFHH